MKPWLRSTIFSCIGVVISTLSSIVLAKLYTGTEWKIEGPLLFAIALVILASHFGAIISVPGSLIGAAMFAFFLYNPQNSFRINSDSERSTLAWMILTSVALSYLLYPTRKVRRRFEVHDNGGAPENSSSARSSEGQEAAKAPAISKRGEIGAAGER